MPMPSARHLLLCLFLICCSFLNGQAQDAEAFDSIRARYSGEACVVSNQYEHLYIELQADSLHIYSDNKTQFAILSEQGKALTHQTIPYSSLVYVSAPAGKTFLPASKNKAEQVYTVRQFNRKDMLQGSVFYSDQKIIEFDLPNLQPGAFTEYTYQQDYNNPRLLSKYFLSSYLPVDHSEFAVTADTSVTLKYYLFGKMPKQLKFTKTITGSTYTLRWSADKLDKFIDESEAPDISYNEAHIIVSVESYLHNGKRDTLLAGLPQLYKWYYQLAKPALEAPIESELQELVNELCKGKKNDEEKLRSIYYWVQDNIKYIAFEYGYGGFIPRNPNSILSNRYGDCKDMSSLLYSMCRAAHIPCHIAWIGTRMFPYTYEENPTAFADNHMIAIAVLGQKKYVLDGTGLFLPLGLPGDVTQGKEALMAIDSSHYEIYTIPVVKKEENKVTDSTYLYIDNDGKLQGHSTRDYSGYMRFDVNAALYTGDQSEKDATMRQLLLKGSNRFSLIDSSMHVVDAGRDEPLHISYDFLLDNYYKKAQDEIFINLNLGEHFRTRYLDTSRRKAAVEFDHSILFEETVALKIPAGYKLDYIPENFSSTEKAWGLTSRYEQRGDLVLLHRSYYFELLQLKPDMFVEWNNWVKKGINASRENIVLSKQK
jgi:transglutaminase-like putative cysteine protease